MAWEDHARIMDEAVDCELGDEVQYAIDGTNFKTYHAFIIDQLDTLGLDGIDSKLSSRHRLKIAKRLIPEIQSTHRFKSSQLGEGIFKPGPDRAEDDGRYWIVDAMKAP